MKVLLLTLATLLLLISLTHAAPNLMANGDFASGVLTPWVATGSPTIDNGVCSLPNASIKQTIATIIGQRYYLGFDPSTGIGGGSLTVSASVTGGAVIKSRTFTFAYPPEAFIVSAVSASTDIVIAGTNISGFGAPSIDNVVLMVLPACKFRGSYNGTVTTTLLLTSPALAQSIATHVKARIDEDGRILILSNGDTLNTGRIFNDGTYFVKPNPYAVLRGTAVVQPIHLILRGDSPGNGGFNDVGNTLIGTSRQIL